MQHYFPLLAHLYSVITSAGREKPMRVRDDNREEVRRMRDVLSRCVVKPDRPWVECWGALSSVPRGTWASVWHTCGQMQFSPVQETNRLHACYRSVISRSSFPPAEDVWKTSWCRSRWLFSVLLKGSLTHWMKEERKDWVSKNFSK